MSQISVPFDAPKGETQEEVNAQLESAQKGEVMVDGQKVELAQPSETPTTSQRPENVPEKFWNAETNEINTEALLKSYAHMESLKGKPDETPNEEASTDGDATTDTAAKKTSEEESSAPFSMETLQTEYTENGELSEDTYAQLEKAGFDKTAVDTYIAGREAIIQKNLNEAYELVGGKEEYSSMMDWAKELPKAEVDKFNAQVQDENLRDLALQSLHKRYTSEKSPTDNLIEGGSSSSSAGYASQEAWLSAMKNPKYDSDPAYRKSVDEKFAASPHLYM